MPLCLPNKLRIDMSIYNIILIDHFDSFTFNLVDLFKQYNCSVTLMRADCNVDIMIETINNTVQPLIVLSPGPGHPRDAHASIKIVQQYYQQLPILGICLGHQIIAHALNGSIHRDETPFHGKSVLVHHSGQLIFKDLPSPMQVARYHSLYVNKIPDQFTVSAHFASMTMSMQHDFFPIFGLQFHPESILTPLGKTLIQNFIDIAAEVKNKERKKEHV